MFAKLLFLPILQSFEDYIGIKEEVKPNLQSLWFF